MENYTHIEEAVKNLPKDVIISKRNSIATSIVLIIVGILMFVLGTKNIVSADCVNMMMIVFGLGLFIYGIIKICMDLSSCHHFYVPTGKRLKKYKVYIVSEDKNKLTNMLKNNQLVQLSEIRKEMTSGCMLYVLTTGDGDYCLAQVLEFSQDEYVGYAPMVIFQGEEATALDQFLKA